MIEKDQIKEFQQIYNKQSTKKISKEEALILSSGLKILAKIISEQYIKDKSKSLTSGGLSDNEKS